MILVMEELEEKLKLTECPFNWDLAGIKDRKPAGVCLERLSEKEEEVAEQWVHICLTLTKAYLHFENREFRIAISILKEGEKNLNSTSCPLIVKYKAAFETVFNASRAVLSTKVSTPTEVEHFFEKVVPYNDLSSSNRAAVLGIKANVNLEFGVSGTTRAVEYAKEALKINPQEPEWHFLMGKLLGRIRHFSQDHDITVSEISHLQTAYSLSPSPRAAIFLASSLIEKSRSLNSNSFKNGGRPDHSLKKRLNELNLEALKLINFAIEKNGKQCVHIMIRCAYCLSKLPYNERQLNKSKAKELLQEALQRSPSNCMANQLAGNLCLNEEKPMYHEALKHFEIAASKNVFSANFSSFEINVKLGMNPDPETFYTKMLKQFTEKSYTLLTLLHATEYYLFIRRDLKMAVTYFMKIMKLDRNFHAINDRWVKYIKKNVNFYELIGNEVRYAIDSQLYKEVDQITLFNDVLDEIKKIKPEIMNTPVVPNIVQDYISLSEENKSADGGSSKGRGRGRGRGRGFVAGGRGRGYVNKGTSRKDDAGEIGRTDETEGVGATAETRGRGRGRHTRGRGERRGGRGGGEVGDIRKETDLKADSQGNVASKSRSTSKSRARRANSNSAENIQFNQVEFDRISYAGDKSEEIMTNPYFVKFLELRYKKMTNTESFKDWLHQYVRNSASTVSDSSNKFNQPSAPESSDSMKIQELVAVLNRFLQISETRLNETRSCCSADSMHHKRCHSLKSLEYNKSDRSQNKFKDQNESYFRSRVEDKDYYNKSEDKYDKVYRSSPPRNKEKYRYSERSPDRKFQRSSHFSDSDRSRRSSRSKCSDKYRNYQRSRKRSFSREEKYDKYHRSSPYRCVEKYSGDSSETRSFDKYKYERKGKDAYVRDKKRDKRHKSRSISPPSRHRGRSSDQRGGCKEFSSYSGSSNSDSRHHRRSKERNERKYSKDLMDHHYHQSYKDPKEDMDTYSRHLKISKNKQTDEKPNKSKKRNPSSRSCSSSSSHEKKIERRNLDQVHYSKRYSSVDKFTGLDIDESIPEHKKRLSRRDSYSKEDKKYLAKKVERPFSQGSLERNSPKNLKKEGFSTADRKEEPSFQERKERSSKVLETKKLYTKDEHFSRSGRPTKKQTQPESSSSDSEIGTIYNRNKKFHDNDIDKDLSSLYKKEVSSKLPSDRDIEKSKSMSRDKASKSSKKRNSSSSSISCHDKDIEKKNDDRGHYSRRCTSIDRSVELSSDESIPEYEGKTKKIDQKDEDRSKSSKSTKKQTQPEPSSSDSEIEYNKNKRFHDTGIDKPLSSFSHSKEASSKMSSDRDIEKTNQSLSRGKASKSSNKSEVLGTKKLYTKDEDFSRSGRPTKKQTHTDSSSSCSEIENRYNRNKKFHDTGIDKASSPSLYKKEASSKLPSDKDNKRSYQSVSHEEYEKTSSG